MTPQAIAASRRLLEHAAPHLIDTVLQRLRLMGQHTPGALSRGVVAEALVLCGNDVDKVVSLRLRWSEQHTYQSFLMFIRASQQ